MSVSVSVLFSPACMCLDDIQLVLGSLVATFWERAAHSVYHMFSLYFDIVILVIPILVLRVGLWF